MAPKKARSGLVAIALWIARPLRLARDWEYEVVTMRRSAFWVRAQMGKSLAARVLLPYCGGIVLMNWPWGVSSSSTRAASMGSSAGF